MKQKNDPQSQHGTEVREIVRGCLTATLATLEPESHDPAASLVAVATDISGTPLLLISDLAHHTHNIEADNRAAMLFDDTADHDSPLAGGRASLKGHLVRLEDDAKIARYLRRHKDAKDYVDFKDFHFYQLDVKQAYFVGGFGKIYTIEASDLLLDDTATQKLVDAEADMVAHMNADHSDALALYAAQQGSAGTDGWEMTGIDPGGLDLRRLGVALRISFPDLVTTPQEARARLVEMAKTARPAS